MIIDWNNSWDSTKSPDWAQAQLVNWYLVVNKRGKLPLAAFPTPGLASFSTGGTSVVRAAYKYNNIPYFVVDNQFISVNASGVRTVLGTLTTSTGKVQIANITNQIGLIDGTRGYIYTVDTNTFTQIVDVDFPNTATSITAMDDYFLVSKPNSPIVNYSDISNGISWNALGIFQKNRVAENVVGIKALHGQIWVAGQTTIEPYFNSGAPFERSQDSILSVGLTSVLTMCSSSDSTMLFLAEQRGGGYMVVQAKQDQYGSCSDTISYQLKNLTTVSDAFAYIYKQEDHEFYVLTFPTDNLTFCYDLTTKSWHKRESLVSGVYGRHLSNCTVSCFGKVLVGDYQSGTIYNMDTQVYTDNSVPIRRKLNTYPFYKEGRYMTGNKLEVLFETGVGAGQLVDVYFSKDDGHTFTAYTPTREIGTVYGARSLLFDRLGSSRSWQFQVITTMTAKCIMLGAVGDFREGAW